MTDLYHHGDMELDDRLLDFAVNVFDGPQPGWLTEALLASLDDSTRYPNQAPAEMALATHLHRPPEEVLATAGAAEAFTLIARLRRWAQPTVIHPQFTEPHAALVQAGHSVQEIYCRADDGFAINLAAIPDNADLVIVGNPTNPTGALHPASNLQSLCRPGRVVVVDEAFMDAVVDHQESLVGLSLPGLLVTRSLTKHWSIPGIRAGYVTGDAHLIKGLRRVQTPWSVSTPALAALQICASDVAESESLQRAQTIANNRAHLESGLIDRGIQVWPSAASFVLAHTDDGAHGRLRALGIAVRRADSFPGLQGGWIRIAVRRPELTNRLFAALDSDKAGTTE